MKPSQHCPYRSGRSRLAGDNACCSGGRVRPVPEDRQPGTRSLAGMLFGFGGWSWNSRWGCVRLVSDKTGGYVRDNPVRPEDFGATLFHTLWACHLKTKLGADGFTRPVSWRASRCWICLGKPVLPSLLASHADVAIIDALDLTFAGVNRRFDIAAFHLENNGALPAHCMWG